MGSSMLSTGQTALRHANWLEAKKCFEEALKTSDSPEAHDGLGLALWWLNEISTSHEQRTLAYLEYKNNGDLPEAARWLPGWRENRFSCGQMSVQ